MCWLGTYVCLARHALTQDYGNAETNNNDDGAGTMECIYFGTCKIWGYGNGTGPWYECVIIASAPEARMNSHGATWPDSAAAACAAG